MHGDAAHDICGHDMYGREIIKELLFSANAPWHTNIDTQFQ